MTRPHSPIEMPVVSPSRRGGGSGEPAPHPVPPTSGSDVPWLLDSREVARLLGISRTKTFQMMARAELPAVRIGRCVRVPREALHQWVVSQGPPEPAMESISWLRRQRPKPRVRTN